MFLPALQLNYNILCHSVKLNQDIPGFGCGKSVINQFEFSKAVITVKKNACMNTLEMQSP